MNKVLLSDLAPGRNFKYKNLLLKKTTDTQKDGKFILTVTCTDGCLLLLPATREVWVYGK